MKHRGAISGRIGQAGCPVDSLLVLLPIVIVERDKNFSSLSHPLGNANPWDFSWARKHLVVDERI